MLEPVGGCQPAAGLAAELVSDRQARTAMVTMWALRQAAATFMGY